MKTATRAMLGLIAALVILLIAALMSPPVWAPAQSRCSPPAGTRALLPAQQGFSDHQPHTCTATSCKGRYVDAAGILRACNAWVPDGGDPAMPKPAPAPITCRSEGPMRWTDAITGAACSSASSQTERLPAGRREGAIANVVADWGRAQGAAVYACRAGRWEPVGSTCTYFNPCARLETITFGSLNGYSVTIDSRSQPEPVGTVLRGIEGAGPGGPIKVDLRCDGGSWTVTGYR